MGLENGIWVERLLMLWVFKGLDGWKDLNVKKKKMYLV